MEETKQTETTTEETVVAPTIAPEEDLEARLAQLEEEKENYRKAYLKEANKKSEVVAGEDEDERMRRIADEAVANSKLAEIAREQDTIIQRALKENKELKLAQLSKTGTPPAAIGGHSEGILVTDTSITPEQLAYFKNTLHWTDKEIELYKKNLRKKV